MGIETSKIGALQSFTRSLPPDSPFSIGSCDRFIQGSWCWVYWSRASEGTPTRPASRCLPPGVFAAFWRLASALPADGFQRNPEEILTLNKSSIDPHLPKFLTVDQLILGSSDQNCWSWTFFCHKTSKFETAHSTAPPAAVHVSWPKSASPHKVSPGTRSVASTDLDFRVVQTVQPPSKILMLAARKL